MTKVHFIETETIINEYLTLEPHIRERYGARLINNDRVLLEAIELNIKGILDERVFSIFSKINDNWEEGLIDILFGGSLSSEDIKEFLNSKVYETANKTIRTIIRRVWEGVDPNFTIWEVCVNPGLDYARIENCGDYRIEQWHKEHSVAKITINETITIDTHHLADFVKRTCNYKVAPSNIETFPKKEVFEDLTTVLCEFMLHGQNIPLERNLINILNMLEDNHLITNAATTLGQLKTYFEFEVDSAIKKAGNFRSISAYVVFAESIVINFGKNRSFVGESFAELELKQAEANGDFIPERLRNKR